MLFNMDKCKVLHIDKNNTKVNYEMGGKSLDLLEEERDLAGRYHNKFRS